MAFDEKLADRVRTALAERKGVSEIKMFGGLCFTVRGNMCCGVNEDELIVRVGPDAYERALAERHVRPMDITGRPLRGFVFVGTDGLGAARSLAKWVERGADFASSLPPKATRPKRRATSGRS